MWRWQQHGGDAAARGRERSRLRGLSADDAAYIMSTFPIVREQDEKAFGRHRTQDDVLARLALLGQGPLA